LSDAARAQALAQLADCEASDWFWWPGEDNPGESVSAFEALFRRKLGNLYRILGQPQCLQAQVPRGTSVSIPRRKPRASLIDVTCTSAIRPR